MALSGKMVGLTHMAQQNVGSEILCAQHRTVISIGLGTAKKSSIEVCKNLLAVCRLLMHWHQASLLYCRL